MKGVLVNWLVYAELVKQIRGKLAGYPARSSILLQFINEAKASSDIKLA